MELNIIILLKKVFYFNKFVTNQKLTTEMVFYKLKNFSLSLGIEPRIFIPRVPQLYHSSTIAQFNVGIRCIYERCVRGFWRQILVYTLLTLHKRCNATDDEEIISFEVKGRTRCFISGKTSLEVVKFNFPDQCSSNCTES